MAIAVSPRLAVCPRFGTQLKPNKCLSRVAGMNAGVAVVYGITGDLYMASPLKKRMLIP